MVWFHNNALSLVTCHNNSSSLRFQTNIQNKATGVRLSKMRKWTTVLSISKQHNQNVFFVLRSTNSTIFGNHYIGQFISLLNAC